MSQVLVPKKTWIKVSEDNCECQVKVFQPTMVFYVEQDEDPNDSMPNPTADDEVLIMASPKDIGGRIEFKYINNNGALWVYSTEADVRIIPK